MLPRLKSSYKYHSPNTAGPAFTKAEKGDIRQQVTQPTAIPLSQPARERVITWE